MAITRSAKALGKSAGTKRLRSSSSPKGSDRSTLVKANSNGPKRLADQKSSTAITFGIEFEFTLAFHEKELHEVLEKYGISGHIVKQLSPSQHVDLLTVTNVDINASYDCRELYPSWTISAPITDYALAKDYTKGANFWNFPLELKTKTRRYVLEPLLVAHKILDSANAPANIVGWLEPDQKEHQATFPGRDSDDIVVRADRADYSRWTLTNDHTLIGALRTQLEDRLTSRGIADTSEELKNWDSYGLELISPIFQLADKATAFSEIGRYIAAFKEGKTWDVMDSVWASTHVHIGFDIADKDEMPMLLLQHIAYIVTVREDLISKCHPKNRSGIAVAAPEPPASPSDNEGEDPVFDDNHYHGTIPPPPEFPTADDVARNDANVRRAESLYKGSDTVASNARYMAHITQSAFPMDHTQIRDYIFSESGTIISLIQLLQKANTSSSTDQLQQPHRGYMVNWSNLWTMHTNTSSTWKPPKPTLEFRQHACTMNPEEIRHWVVFLEAIMRAAERMAAARSNDPTTANATNLGMSFAEREGKKYISSFSPSSSSNSETWPCKSISAFCTTFLRLDQVETAYWQGRFDRFSDDRP